MADKSWAPTHRLTWIDGRMDEVMLAEAGEDNDWDQDNGPAYTWDEWDAYSSADFELRGGHWYHLGQLFTGHAERLA